MPATRSTSASSSKSRDYIYKRRAKHARKPNPDCSSSRVVVQYRPQDTIGVNDNQMDPQGFFRPFYSPEPANVPGPYSTESNTDAPMHDPIQSSPLPFPSHFTLRFDDCHAQHIPGWSTFNYPDCVECYGIQYASLLNLSDTVLSSSHSSNGMDHLLSPTTPLSQLVQSPVSTIVANTSSMARIPLMLTAY